MAGRPASHYRSTIPLLFFVSGFCGLLYQLVWIRLAFASFGVNIPVLSVVVSVFMTGLGIGSWAGGAWTRRWSKARAGIPLFYYGAAESLIAFGALAVPALFRWGRTWLYSMGSADSGPYLFLSACVLFLSLLPWCVAMGATFPFMMEFLRRKDPSSRAFSFLYTANVMGAMTGVVVTAYLLIEKLGFHGTLSLACCLNASIALCSFVLGAVAYRDKVTAPQAKAVGRKGKEGEKGIMPILFLTGFICMAMEVVWTRGFTLVLHTEVYSFASLLFFYLLSTFLGSVLYRRRGASWALGRPLLTGAAFGTSLLVLLLDDPSFHHSRILVLLSIVPFSLVLGYLTPQLVDQVSQGDPSRAARAYAVNILGCILGPLAASYLLLPWVGVKGSLLLLSLPLVAFFLRPLGAFWKAQRPSHRIWGAGLPALLLTFCLFQAKDYELVAARYFREHRLYRDYVATVTSAGKIGERQLFVNGISMTGLVQATKDMAYLPLLLHGGDPSSALVICFGMGTTYRALTQWGLEVTSVELVPSVYRAFSFFWEDAPEVLAHAKGKRVVDDGRRYLARTTDTYDLITVDPPPPLEAAGSSLLYSVEFYDLVKKRLKPGGLLQQWIPGGERAIWEAACASMNRSFPYIRAFPNPEKIGCHFICSMTPIKIPGPEVDLRARMPVAAWKDEGGWLPPGRTEDYLRYLLSRAYKLDPYLIPGGPMITDDRPFNEYYFLRRSFLNSLSPR